MEMTRKTLVITALVASFGLLAACSKTEEPAAPAVSSTVPAPAPSSSPTPAPVPPVSQDQSAVEPTQQAKDKIAEVGQAVSQDADALADKAGQAANSARESVEAGAAKADAAIQDTVGDKK